MYTSAKSQEKRPLMGSNSQAPSQMKMDFFKHNVGGDEMARTPRRMALCAQTQHLSANKATMTKYGMILRLAPDTTRTNSYPL
mmetsp:Transcript_60465/g.71821  ORF Transcript_60465/g.71821 Transcript_60465/m.71821 type:complete len:83 (-) Transcript_60465:483-731(-)